jgi:hypothetical protein
MPQYTIRNTKTEERETVIMSYEALQEHLNENPDWVQVIGAPKLVSGVGGVLSKNSDGFRDVLREMKKTSGRGNTINV